MPCNDPISKCVEITPSACVKFTGSFETNSRTTYDCHTSLNSILSQFDKNITLVLDHTEITVTELKDADTCKKIYDNIEALKVKSTDGFVYTDVVVLELVKIVCDLQRQIAIIHDETTLSSDFFDLKLPQDILNFIACLVCDDACDPVLPLTLRDFFEIVARKVKSLPCEDCGGCVNC